MNNTAIQPVFLRLAALCALASAVTTFLLWWLPFQFTSPTTFDERIALAANPWYLARLWVNFVHLFLAMAGYAGFAWFAARRSPVLAWSGLVLMGLWALAEMFAISLNLWAQNAAWRAGYAAADAEVQSMIRTGLFLFQGVWDALFFIVLIAFFLGTLCLGFSVRPDQLIDKVVGVLLLLAAPLTATIMLDGYFGFNLGHWIEWSYPVLQPASRALMGYWIWRQVSEFGMRSG
jgi:hypothetical protein